MEKREGREGFPNVNIKGNPQFHCASDTPEMHLSTMTFGLGPFLLLWILVAFSNVEALIPPSTHGPTPTLHTYGGAYSRSWLARVRDGLIEALWPISPRSPPGRTDANTLQMVNPPSKLLARYGGDLVLRFRIGSSGECEALMDAINILFLDVWEFTSDWVDIRISKDVVSPS